MQSVKKLKKYTLSPQHLTIYARYQTLTKNRLTSSHHLCFARAGIQEQGDHHQQHKKCVSLHLVDVLTGPKAVLFAKYILQFSPSFLLASTANISPGLFAPFLLFAQVQRSGEKERDKSEESKAIEPIYQMKRLFVLLQQKKGCLSFLVLAFLGWAFPERKKSRRPLSVFALLHTSFIPLAIKLMVK